MRLGRSVVVTGHRPPGLYPEGTPPSFQHWLGDLSSLAATEIAKLQAQQRVDQYLVGMALGWDMAFATACASLAIPFTAVIPFEGQERLWSGAEQMHYRDLLAQASRVKVVAQHSLNIAYQQRNEWMIDHGTGVLALWNGQPGGTGNAVRYAKAQWDMPVENVWNAWEPLSRKYDRS